ncbi:peptidylprolyl isomerase [Stieleria sp. ICT_E10.1]|uniref:peptidylprolyl isomerase n=1 Tax=Stieleria sedimenti TaxID=2976331 RepID=UPI00218039F0|nr:peptidylprolyl isomerase [Stieleria sedimenti]MCS7467509.1 peptidylprolyl isomerase [Stieleria sedimenti]
MIACLQPSPTSVVRQPHTARWIHGVLIALLVLPTSLFVLPTTLLGEPPALRPTDPIASIDGEPVFLGELHFLLSSKLKANDLSQVSLDVQRASSALLVRQHLAMKSLRQQGGANLQALLDRDWEEFLDDLRRKRSNLDEYCTQRQTDERSVRNARDWDSAWRRYLKSKMTDANLKRFYELHSENYSSARWNVSHLFIEVDKEIPDAEAIAEQRIQTIASQLQSESGSPEILAKRFAELAISESEGATAKQGGGLGWVSKPGDLPAAVMDAIGQTKTAAVSKPVRSPLGFHLVLVHKKEVDQIPYENVTDLNPLRRDAATALFDALVAHQSSAKVTWYIKSLQPPGV